MATATSTAVGGGTAGLNWKAALSYLATGRYAECLQAVRRAARRREIADRGAAAVVECDALLGLLRSADAAAVAARALRRSDADPDTRARLRVSRGQALWLLGRTTPGRAEVLRGAREATGPLAKARAAEVLALIAWKERDAAGDARGHVAEAMRLYAEAGSDLGVARCLGIEAGALRDEGRFAEALKVQAGRIAVASATTSLEAQAEAHDDRGDLLAYLGRWEEARVELDEAAELYRQIASPRAAASAPRRAMLSLAHGDLTSVRAAVDRSAAPATGGARDPRSLGEHWLLASDLHLASNEGRSAERAGSEALRLFRLAKDPSGECRARVRRVHALLADGQRGEAVLEARRAVRLASRRRVGQESLVWLALGRALLHAGAREAERAFERSRSTAGPRKWLEAAARLGGALARGAGRDDPVVASALEALDRWGDRRLLAHVLKDLHTLRGPSEARAATPEVAAASVRPCSSAAAVAAAVEALSGEGGWPERWAGAMEALRPVVPWFRAAWLRRGDGLLVTSSSHPTQLPRGDVARDVGAAGGPPRVWVLPEAAGSHPVVVMHDLYWAAVVTTSCGGRLYVDARRGDRPLEAGHVALLELVARVLVRYEGAAPAEAEPRAAFPEIVGRSAPMAGLFADMARVASSELFVHIFGETGTGKERVARALHARSPRGRGPFVAVNASSLSDDLFESELFGHVRGAFTGAVAERRGYVAEAEGGTLFIDEVTDLSARCQSKLLRFLTDKEFRRLGESETRRADIRLLTAANASLPERVAAGAFRQDLMYRVDGMTLTLPPLRERADDVLVLARHFLAQKTGRSRVALSPEAARALLRYRWPGNVRELENEMDRVATFALSGAVCGEHLSAHVREARPTPFRTLEDAVSAFERDVIVGALAQHGGNRSRTACALGISRQGLLGKIQRYGI